MGRGVLIGNGKYMDLVDAYEQSELDKTMKEEKRKRSDSVISKKAVRKYIKENGKRITQVDPLFYTALDNRVKQIILSSILNNCSRKKLTASELH